MAKAFDYVITGGLVFDGLGNAPVREDVAVKDGRIKQGDMVLLEAMGGGFTWGSALIRW